MNIKLLLLLLAVIVAYYIGYFVAVRHYEAVIVRLENTFQMSIDR